MARLLTHTVLLTLFIQGITVALWAQGVRSSHHTGFLAPFTCGVRIHHGYVGALLVLAVAAVPRAWWPPLIVLGGALVLSDATHHVFVLQSFDLTYPGYPPLQCGG